MNAINKTVLACLAALSLAACNSTGGNSTNTSSKDSGSRASQNAAPAESSACKLLKDNEGRGKNIVYRCNIAAVLKTEGAKSELTSMPISYGGTGALRTNATSRSFGRDEAASCERAVVNGLNNLQNPRRAKGTVRRLSSVGSYAAGNNGKFESGRMAPAGYADCIVATWQSRTVMRGTPQY